MDIQTAIVVVIALICVVFLIRKYARAAKGTGGGGCGCGCGDNCPSEKRGRCEGNEGSSRL